MGSERPYKLTSAGQLVIAAGSQRQPAEVATGNTSRRRTNSRSGGEQSLWSFSGPNSKEATVVYILYRGPTFS